VVQPRIHEVCYGRFQKSSEVGLETTDLSENHQENILVRWEEVQNFLALIVHVRWMGTPRDFRNCSMHDMSPRTLICADEGKAGLDWAIDGVTRKTPGWNRRIRPRHELVWVPRDWHCGREDEDRNWLVWWGTSTEDVDWGQRRGRQRGSWKRRRKGKDIKCRG